MTLTRMSSEQVIMTQLTAYETCDNDVIMQEHTTYHDVDDGCRDEESDQPETGNYLLTLTWGTPGARQERMHNDNIPVHV